MIDVNELRNGVTFLLDDQLFKVIEYSHNKPGRGKATIRTKVRNMRTGEMLEKSFISGSRVENVRLDYREAQYLYEQNGLYVFMDNETYEQPMISSAIMGEAVNYLMEGLVVKLTFLEDEAIDVELPTAVELEVVEAEMAVKGDTATGATKLVVTETGLKVQVPLFVEVGDRIKVDTRSGEYLTRV